MIPARPVLARGARQIAVGLAATGAMTLSTSLERTCRRHLDHPVDYDASDHVVTAVERVLRRPARTTTEERVYFAMAHWGYGSAVSSAYGPLRRRLPEPLAAVAFFTGCQAMAMTLFPLIGGTPPPHRWHRDQLASSVWQHAVYTAVVVGLHRRTSGPRRSTDLRLRPPGPRRAPGTPRRPPTGSSGSSCPTCAPTTEETHDQP